MKSLEQGAACLPDGKKPLGAFICQGKVDPKLIEAMYRMFPSDNIHGKNPKMKPVTRPPPPILMKRI